MFSKSSSERGETILHSKVRLTLQNSQETRLLKCTTKQKTKKKGLLVNWDAATATKILLFRVDTSAAMKSKILEACYMWTQTDLISWISEILRGDMTALASDFLRSESKNIPRTTKLVMVRDLNIQTSDYPFHFKSHISTGNKWLNCNIYESFHKY